MVIRLRGNCRIPAKIALRVPVITFVNYFTYYRIPVAFNKAAINMFANDRPMSQTQPRPIN